MRLPGRSGSEIIGELRHKTTTKNLKILALTSNPVQEYLFWSISQPKDYLFKPINQEQLLHQIHNSLSINRDN
jgi:DNA-binding response OmpR family regulator